MKFEINKNKRLTCDWDIFNREHYFWSYIFLAFVYDNSYTNILGWSMFLDNISELIPCDECHNNLQKHRKSFENDDVYWKLYLTTKESWSMLSTLFYLSWSSRLKKFRLWVFIKEVKSFVNKYSYWEPYYNPITLAMIEFLLYKWFTNKDISYLIDFQAYYHNKRYTDYDSYIEEYNKFVYKNMRVGMLNIFTKEEFEELYKY